jgi:hypothetical protein
MQSKHQIKYLTLTIVLGLSIAFLINSCKKSSNPFVPPSTSSLTVSIDSAQWYLANTHEGTQAGEYLKGSQATLQTALTAAQGVLTASATSGTQADVNNAVAQLNAAIAVYEGGVVAQIAPSALVAYWKFNGNANDSVGNHNGTLEACPADSGGIGLITTVGVSLGAAPNLTVDRFGNANAAYHFANGGNIDVPFSPALNPTAMTISLWERQDTAGRIDGASNCYMVSLNRWNGYKFQMQPVRPFYSVTTVTKEYDQDGGVAIAIGTTLGSGPWHHLVVTYDGVGTTLYYVDGVLLTASKYGGTQATGAIKAISPSVDLAIGTDLTNNAYAYNLASPNYIAWGGYWTGDLDDVMIYNVALTTAQVTALYNQQVTQ